VSVTYWDIGLSGANRPDDPHWVYFPERDLPFYRAGSTSAAVPSAAPAGCRSLYVEVSHPRGKVCGVTDAHVLAGLRRVGLVGERQEPLFAERSTLDCAYVIMDHAYGAARATLLDWLAREHILSVGRYGAWTYDSMEGAMIQGRDAAARVRDMT
ncbi:MAG: amine oxidase, partial [Deltaproteobacteria bacterium]|nr:amine oxidase [Deltaproteobacteria bacterium]